MLDLSIIIVSWNVRDYLRRSLTSVFKEVRRANLCAEVWVVDNGSTDGTLALLDSLFPQVHVIANEENVGFGAANNQGMRAAAEKEPRYHFLLNADTVVLPNGIGALVDFLDENVDVGMAGARLIYGDGRFQHSAFGFPGLLQLAFDLFSVPERLYETRWNGRYPRRYYDPQREPFPVDHPLGATMLVRRDVAEVTGGFDESFHMYCEEIDWAWRIRKAGWPIYTVPAAEIIHYGGASTGQVPARSVRELWQSRAQLYEKHHTPWRRKAARKLAEFGLRRRAEKAENPALREAYEASVDRWQQVTS